MIRPALALFFPLLPLLLSGLLAPPLFAAEPPLRIPVVSPYAGQLATFGEGVKNGALLAGEELNAAGGIKGRKVEIVLEDDQCAATEAASIATKLAADKGVAIVVGHLCSSATLAALPKYDAARLPFISPASTNPTIGKMSAYSFRNVYSDNFQGTFLAQYAAKAMGVKRVAIFYEVNDYSMGLREAFTAEAKKLGLSIVSEESFSGDITDFTPQVTKLKAAKPEAVFLPIYAHKGTLIISQAAKLGMKGVPWFGADGMDDDAVKGNPDAEGLLVTTPFQVDKAGPEAKAFIAAYAKRFGKEPNWFAANTYDAVRMAGAALAAVGPDREKVRGWLAGIDSPAKAYKGVAGATYFDANGDCLKPAFIKVLRGGKWVSAEKQLL